MLMKEVCKALKAYDNALKVIAAGYADFAKVGCLNPLKLPQVACRVEADGVMIDVKMKTSESKLFSFLSDKELKKFVDEAHSYNLIAALAGSLDMYDIQRVYNLGADVIGVRRTVCSNKDRVNGEIQRKAVSKFAKKIDMCEKQPNSQHLGIN